MIYSGIDWSGDTGDPDKSDLSSMFAVAVAHIAEGDLLLLDSVLESVRIQRGLPENFTFRHSSCAASVKRAFFEAMISVPIAVRVRVTDKRQWSRDYFRSRSHKVIGCFIGDVLNACPPYCVEDQIIRIDLTKNEMKTFRDIKRAVNDRLDDSRFKKRPQLRPVPDHKLDGRIVQVADMFAGAVNQARGNSSDMLLPLKKKIDLI